MVRPHVRERVALPYAQHYLDLLAQFIRSRPIALVDHVELGDLHDARLQRLNPVARFGYEYQHRGFGGRGDVELGLADADRFDEDAVESGGLEHICDLFGGRGEPALRSPRGHRANEHAGIEAHRFHANPVAEQRAAGEGAGGIDGDDGYLETALAIGANQLLGESALPGAWWPGDADAMGTSLPDLPVQCRQHTLEPVALVLDQADCSGQRRGVAARQPLEHRVESHMP